MERALTPEQRCDPPASIPGAALFFTTLEGAPKIKKTVHGMAIDEGNLATTIQGLSLMRSFPSVGHWLIVGDERQLPPLVLSQGIFHTRAFSSLLDSAELAGASTCDIAVQRRIPVDRAAALGKWCYGGVISSEGVVPTAAIEFSFVGKPSSSHTSLSNSQEATWMREKLIRLIDVAAPFGGWKIGVLCYYTAQAQLCSGLLGSLVLRGSVVEVTTVDSAEGLEYEATIILLSTPTLNSYLADWGRA